MMDVLHNREASGDSGLKKIRSAGRLSAIWQRIDRIYCISLVDRKDRQACARRQFDSVGLSDKVDFHFVHRHPRNSEQGIYESHQACLKMGLDAGARHVLVFEDDVVFGPVDADRLSAGIDFFMQQKDCSLLLLGCLVGKSHPTQSPFVRRVRYRCLTHAYLADAPLARKMVETPWQGLAFDAALRHWPDHHFVLYPSIAFQSNAPTDNTRHLRLDRIRRLFGGMRIIQLANEHYHRYPVIVIAAHVLVVGALMLWIIAG